MSQIKTKFISDNAVTGAKARLNSAEYLRSRNAGNTADLNLFHANSSDQIESGGDLYLAGFQLKNVADPSLSTDAATKSYVDSTALGLSPKSPVNAATTAPLASNTYANGTSGVGATLTATANGALASVDGYTAVLDDRLLVKDEVTGSHNGIYAVTQVGTGGSPYILTRTSDANTASGLKGAYTFALAGTANSNHEFLLTNPTPDTPPTIGTTTLTFIDFGSSTVTAGNGLTKTGSTLSFNPGSGLGFSGSQAVVEVQGPGTTNTTDFDGSSNIKSLHAVKESLTLGSQDITNQYVDLANVAHTGSIQLIPGGAITQKEGSDYSLNYTGGSGSKTRLTFLGDLATGGTAALVAGDVLAVNYQTL